MSRVETYSNWCEIDQLDGKDVKDGELLWISWPDSLTQQFRVKVKMDYFEVNDMGHPWSCPRSKAYVEIHYHGKAVDVPIAGLVALRSHIEYKAGDEDR